MYDYGISILEQYALTAKSSSRIRGALLCHTEKGPVIIREFRGSEKKLIKQQELLNAVEQKGYRVDSYLLNEEGGLVSRDRDNIPYTVQRWYEGRECDTRSREDILKGVRTLANIHKEMKLPVVEYYKEPDLRDEYRRHNQEMKKIRKFIRRKSPSCSFEKEFLFSVEGFLEKGQEALEMLSGSGYEKLRARAWEKGTICHGEYNQHNVLILGRETAVVNFSHWGFDIQMADLYRFMRKILEKYNWDSELAEEMLECYGKEQPISPEEWRYLQIRFTYPDKYWKIANYYYSHNKAWISEKNTEKLKDIIRQKERWDRFGRITQKWQAF